MANFTFDQLLADRHRMKAFVAMRIPEEGCRIVLADGPVGEVWADLNPVRYGDGEMDVHLETNCREAVCLPDIYMHFRRQEMTWWEWQRELRSAVELYSLRKLAADPLTCIVELNDRRRRELIRDREPPQETALPLSSTVVCGDCKEALPCLPAQSVGLVFTSIPYFNARPEYALYQSYEAFLGEIRDVLGEVIRVLESGRFLVVNVSHVLQPRRCRNDSSRRLALPCHLAMMLEAEGLEFVDEIVWKKPDGAGCGRSRKFSQFPFPLYYKSEPVTERLLVYRKSSGKRVEHHVRDHPDQAAVRASMIQGDFGRTDVWEINPVRSPVHPAPFPLELAERVVERYSFKGDLVLDPFAGIGTVGIACLGLARRYYLIERVKTYVEEFYSWKGRLSSQPDLGPALDELSQGATRASGGGRRAEGRSGLL
jgi:DNA modification methylase